jgi:hypothetical protein
MTKFVQSKGTSMFFNGGGSLGKFFNGGMVIELKAR